METLTTVPLLIIGDFGMRKLPLTAAEDLLEIIMRRYERASTLLKSLEPLAPLPELNRRLRRPDVTGRFLNLRAVDSSVLSVPENRGAYTKTEFAQLSLGVFGIMPNFVLLVVDQGAVATNIDAYRSRFRVAMALNGRSVGANRWWRGICDS
jgi:hypothetical protein